VIRIEYFIDHLKVGGAQRHLVELFSGLDRQRFAPQVCVAKGGGALVPLIERMGIPVRTFGVAGSLAHPATLAGLVATARRLRAERVHVVHGYLYEGNILGVLAGRLAGTPVRLASKRSLDRYPRRSQRTATRLANAWAHRIVCNADAVSRFVLEEERPATAKLVVIPNGIRFATAPMASERPAGVPSGVKLVGAVGRLNWKKAYHHLLDAAARVRAVRDDVEFVVVGDGPMRGEVEAEATRLGIRPYVHLLGEIRDARSLMRSFDVFVMSSVIEGMPNVLLEALSAERPVVVTGVGGIPEIVAHEKSGLVVPPGDPGALAAGVLRLLANPTEAAAFGSAGRRTVESRFSVPAMVESFTRLYEECLGAAGVAFGSPAPASLASGRL
jgi:glycosyltransferase involved in cell wall biosynthesis